MVDGCTHVKKHSLFGCIPDEQDKLCGNHVLQFQNPYPRYIVRPLSPAETSTCKRRNKCMRMRKFFFYFARAALLQRLQLRKKSEMSSREEAPGSRHSLTGQDSEAAGHRHHRKGHRRSIMHANVAESMKMKQV